MVAGAVLAGAGLVGCDGANAEPEPDREPTTTQPEELATPDPEETDSEPGDDEPGPQDYPHPEPGPDIDDEGQAGAEAAAVYFVELFSYIHATGDFEAWDELTTEDCNFCDGVRLSVAELYASGGYEITNPPVIREVNSRVWESTPGDYLVDSVIEVAASETYDARGDSMDAFPAETVRVLTVVKYDGARWFVVGADAEDLV
ncbi:DUF6318 family protein [Pseudactinotalea sp. Z1732]|uniref:DUF6318 family protein n=1 Tax=Micrococcales TaxID=85006 RepID=UPI003C79741C